MTHEVRYLLDLTTLHISSCCLLYWQVIEFADDESKRVYEEAYEAFKARHLTRDQFVEFSTKNELPGFVKRLAVRDPEHELPSWMTSNCFCLASCCCLSWPYRLIFNSSVSAYSYQIVKKVLARPGAIVVQPQTASDIHPLPEEATLEPSAPLLPIIPYIQCPDDIPVIPCSQVPAAPPPSYEEVTGNPDMFGHTKHGVHESIPLSEMRM